ncbi:hypothetical protein Tco_1312698 [Tanacetum coccineum]
MSKEAGTPRYLSLVVPLKKVSVEAVHKELGDIMERAATTTSSLEAEQDSATADGDDDDDEDEDEDEDEEEEEEHPTPADSVPPIPSPPLPIPSPPPNSPTHIEIPESCLPLQKRVHFVLLLPPLVMRSGRVQQPVLAKCRDRPAIVWKTLKSVARDDLVEPSMRLPDHPRGVNHEVMSLSTIVDAGDLPSCMVNKGEMHKITRISTERPSQLIVIVAQSALISELQSADHRRQRVISELLASDHKRQVQLTKTLRLLKGLQTQMVEFQRQHGPAKGPA